jgi:hypothetical protein
MVEPWTGPVVGHCFPICEGRGKQARNVPGPLLNPGKVIGPEPMTGQSAGTGSLLFLSKPSASLELFLIRLVAIAGAAFTFQVRQQRTPVPTPSGRR